MASWQMEFGNWEDNSIVLESTGTNLVCKSGFSYLPIHLKRQNIQYRVESVERPQFDF